MRVMAGWIALTPEIPAKLLLGRQVWDCAQHADLWGKRLPELRAPGQVSEPSGPGFVRFLDALESREAWGETIERLTGVYRVLKPHLVSAYDAHLGRTNSVYEPPTRRILERCLGDERRHQAEGAAVLESLARTPAERARLTAWERELRGMLDAHGGVTGRRCDDPRPHWRERRARAGGSEPCRADRRPRPERLARSRAGRGGHPAGPHRVADGTPVQGRRARGPRPDRNPSRPQDEVRRGRPPSWCRRAGSPTTAAAGASVKRRSPASKTRPPGHRGPCPGPERSDPVPDSVLVANRGEIALRIIRTCRRLGIRPVAVYSEADAGALHVRAADAALADRTGARARELPVDRPLLGAAREARVDAVHPGYGFLSENWRFAEACRDAGITSWVRLPRCCGRWATRRRRADSSAAPAFRSCRAPTAPSRAPGRRARSPTRSATR